MECIPAVDIRGGEAVRLVRGQFGEETTFGDPLELAERYVAAGARRLHVVDLDAARTGRPVNFSTVVSLVERAKVPVQVGGGVRSLDAAEALFDSGVDGVVVGTGAIEDGNLLAEMSRRHPRRVWFGLDHREARVEGRSIREVAVRGWEVGSGVALEEALGAVEELALAGVVVTDIGRDGTLDGPDIDGLGVVLAMTALPVVASGGVATVADLVALRSLEMEGRFLAGVIVGRAFATGALAIEEAVTACAR